MVSGVVPGGETLVRSIAGRLPRNSGHQLWKCARGTPLRLYPFHIRFSQACARHHAFGTKLIHAAHPRVTTYATHMHAQVAPRRPGVASPARDNQWPTGRRARARGRTYHSPAPVHAPPAASHARSASSPPGAARRPHRGAGRQVRQPAHARAWRVCEKGAHEARGRRVGRAGGRGSETCCELAL